MNLIAFALRKPITLATVILSLVGGGLLALSQMRVDIFPALNMPQIYVVNNYAGMDPSQIEGFITNVYEQNFQYVDGMKSIESKNIQNLTLIKLTFYPGTDMSAAMSQVVSLANRAGGQMPPSVLPTFVMRFDAANVPIGYLVLDSATRPLGQLTDLGIFRIKPLLVEQVPGTVSFAPFGSNTRAIVVMVDPDRLRSYNLSPEDVVRALGTGNVVAPSGNLYTRGQMPLVQTNAMVADPQELASIPIQAGKNVYIRDVATVQDGTDINFGCALVNSRKSVYIPVVKKDTASTLTVVQQIHKAMPLFRSAVPEDVQVRYEFDESPTVRASIKTVASEAAIGAVLTGLMILIFLRDLRSVVVVLVSIPLSLVGALLGLWLFGHTINIMSLGGLALSIGILVDVGIVTVENTHAQMHHATSITRAVRQSDAATASARLLSMLCVLAVFIPTFLMKEPVRSLFMPLTVAVGVAMIVAFVLSSTVVPVMSVWLLRHQPKLVGPEGFLDRMLPRFGRIVRGIVRRRRLVVPAYLVVCGLVLWFVGRQVGTELFPQVDSGQFVLRFRTPPGSNYELTRKVATKILEVIDEQAKHEVAISMGYVGLAATNTATNNLLLFMRGTDDGQLRVRLQPDTHVRLSDLRDRLRKALPEEVVPWLAGVLEQTGWSHEEAQARARLTSFGFEPGDVVSQVMSFGSPTPIEVVVMGSNRDDIRAHALKVLGEMKKISTLRDVQLYQLLDYPTVRIDIDRERAGLSGVSIKDVTDALLVGTSSSRYVARNYWRDPKSGVDYQIQVQVPAQRMDRPEKIETLPLQKIDADTNLLVRDVATVRPGTTPGQIDRSSMQRYLSVVANVEGEDLGRATQHIYQALADAGQPPRGVRVQVRGQVAPMEEMFRSLAVGLALAVVVILIMLTGYFQSLRLGLISIGSVPGVVAGVATILWLTGTTLNIESFMGSIMCIGVSVSNSVLLSTFMEADWRKGMSLERAAVKAAKDRLRPILMTAIAMLLGTLPMALALEKGSEMTAPLGWAVIGGLVVSTFATLLVVPALFTLLMRGAKRMPPSLDPDDPTSLYYDGGEAAAAHPAERTRAAATGSEPASPDACQQLPPPPLSSSGAP
ncbi:MAG: efflux RND transporter permease subunit [Planctomycetota bacterium]|nr:efflux RND transporter permease subunit [Planctomycetota bacterium]